MASSSVVEQDGGPQHVIPHSHPCNFTVENRNLVVENALVIERESKA